MLNKKTFLWVGVLFLAGLTAFVVTRPVSVPVTGLLRQVDGETADPGYYDLRVVGFDPVSGEQTIAQDFTDVYVSEGRYELPVSISRFSSGGESLLQVCRSENPSNNPNGVQEGTPTGCREAVEQQKTFTFAECPQTVSISSIGVVGKLLGGVKADIKAECAYDVSTAEETGSPLAKSNATSPSIFAKGEKGDIGAAGPKGENGTDGVNGVDGVAGSQGAQGDRKSVV